MIYNIILVYGTIINKKFIWYLKYFKIIIGIVSIIWIIYNFRESVKKILVINIYVFNKVDDYTASNVICICIYITHCHIANNVICSSSGIYNVIN